MNLIKINAIDSTSRFLKDLAKNEAIENFTTVVAEAQTSGKGQRNTQWHSAPGLNLLFTVFVDFQGLDFEFAPELNFLVASVIREVVEKQTQEKGKIQIKWPNDILSYHQKMAGILVENSIKNKQIDASFIGVGLNVNQTVFPDFLPNATSISNIIGLECNKELLLTEILNKFKKVLTKKYIVLHRKEIKAMYLKHLYKYQTPTMFKDVVGKVFMGKITDVSCLGKLIIEKEDEQSYEYDIKEIRFL